MAKFGLLNFFGLGTPEGNDFARMKGLKSNFLRFKILIIFAKENVDIVAVHEKVC